MVTISDRRWLCIGAAVLVCLGCLVLVAPAHAGSAEDGKVKAAPAGEAPPTPKNEDAPAARLPPEVEEAKPKTAPPLAAPATCGGVPGECLNDDGSPVSYEDGGAKVACVYVVNVYQEQANDLMNNTWSECQFLRRVGGDAVRDRRVEVKTAHLLERHASNAKKQRFSTEGAVIVRAFDATTRAGLPLHKLGGKERSMGLVSGENASNGEIYDYTARANTNTFGKVAPGDPIEVTLSRDGAPMVERKGWFLPRDGVFLDYQFGLTGYVFKESRVTALPASVELQYRTWKLKDLQADLAFGLAPYLSSEGKVDLTGGAAYLRGGISGVQLGGGVLWRPDAAKKVVPFLLVSFSDVILQKLKGDRGGITEL